MNKTIELAPNSLLLRAYVWAWDADASKTNFCKMFWGILFFPVALPFHLAGWIYEKVFLRFAGSPAKTAEDYEAAWQRIKQRREKRQRILDKLEGLFWKLRLNYVGKALGILAIIAAIAFVAWCFYLVIDKHGILTTLAIIVGTFVGMAIGAAIVAILAHLVPKLGGPLTTAGDFMGAGYHMVKDKTCPTIVVKSDLDNRPESHTI